ncbi:hypothetical protein AVEN_20559-1 [Araneus ventricosus]|uniref:Uncharacterized protein n=1 Tax=Araneus ventricosus TaxID=182803 RepID=A0A4Y2GWF4_ARAVE|nr:hypothetical protein AVEN_20559-1 [Araneus ventricosus]
MRILIVNRKEGPVHHLALPEASNTEPLASRSTGLSSLNNETSFLSLRDLVFLTIFRRIVSIYGQEPLSNTVIWESVQKNNFDVSFALTPFPTSVARPEQPAIKNSSLGREIFL